MFCQYIHTDELISTVFGDKEFFRNALLKGHVQLNGEVIRPAQVVYIQEGNYLRVGPDMYVLRPQIAAHYAGDAVV